MENTIFFTTLLAALGSGLIAGAFFVFSVGVMRGLGLRPASEGMAAMQAINIVIINPLFIGVFLGTAVVSGLAAVAGVLRWEPPRSGYLLAAAIIYIVGSVAVTMILNVPLNNALVAADSASASGREIWKNYLTNWTFWNHIRTAASLAALLFFILALTGDR